MIAFLLSAIDIFSILGSTMLALGLVCALTYTLFRLLRCPLAYRSGRGMIRVLASCPLHARQSLYVIEVGERRWLVASSERGVLLIDELDSLIDPKEHRAESLDTTRSTFVDSLAAGVKRIRV